MDKKTSQKINFPNQKGPGLFSVIKPYGKIIALLILLAMLGNGLNLLIPKIISSGIDGFMRHTPVLKKILIEFSLASLFIFIFSYLQSIVQTYASERVARDLRNQLSSKISRQSNAFVQKMTAGKLLTNLTSDIDSVKMFVAQAISSIISSLFIIIGAAALLLSINWKLGLTVLAIIPLISGTFFMILGKVRKLFLKAREIIDRLNKVINESILGSALIRVLNSQQAEYEKFLEANTNAKNLGLQILKMFATMIPLIIFISNLAVLAILSLGGHFVINGQMSLGNLAAFYSYLSILIFPIMIIGFMSNVIAQAQASYGRVIEVLNAEEEKITGTLTIPLKGGISLTGINLSFGEKPVLRDVGLEIQPGTKTAILGPTAAGKTQMLYILIGLINPDSGRIKYDGKDIDEYDRQSLHKQIGFVFQDSIIFNMSLKENIAFNTQVSEEDFKKAIETAELGDFINNLPQGLNTIVSERGASLSGGQKQRVMLARALALNPKILLLDDFTARVDTRTEQKILENVARNYPSITLLSVTQKVASVEHYDQIVLLMEGEIIARGKHEELLGNSPEYAQIYNSQQSTSHYEKVLEA